ncbi:MAG TPA: hypothetical protein VFE05_03880 [Longimicrobiaceae bacterium]|jgi:hypothetical protein|nr:hypothetical protein [Longimicrobiaceae bacterium]
MTRAGGAVLRLRGGARPAPDHAGPAPGPAARAPLVRRLLAWLGLG